MTLIHYPHEIEVLHVRDGISTVREGCAEIKLSALDVEDSESYTFGGFGGKIVRDRHVEEVMTRKEKRELRRAMQLIRKGDYAELMRLYGSYKPETVEHVVHKRTMKMPRTIGSRFTINGIITTAASSRRGTSYGS